MSNITSQNAVEAQRAVKRIEAKVKAREDARDIAEMLFPAWEDGTGHQYAESFLKELRELLPMREADRPETPKLEPIARLGAVQMDYGEFAGQTYDTVPLERLDWYMRMSEANVKSLKDYLTHPDLRSRRAAEWHEAERPQPF